MSGDVAVQNLPPAMLNEQEAVQQFEGQRRYREKVERDDRLAVIGEKCLPALIVFAGPGPQASQIPGNGTFGDVEAELEQFSWSFGAPQPRFSSLILRMRLRISSLTLGRPPC